MHEKAKKPDKMNEDSLKKGLSNLDDNENLVVVLLKISKRINDLEIVTAFSLILLIVLMVGLAIN